MIERLLSRRWLLILTALAAVTFVLSGWMAVDKYRTAAQLDQAQRLVELTLRVARAVHELQSERSLSLGYLASHRKRFAAALAAQRRRTDERGIELAQYARRIDAAILPGLDTDMRAMIADPAMRLRALRALVDKRGASESEVFRRFALDVGSLLEMAARAVASQQVLEAGAGASSGQVMAFLALLRAKEEAGIERSLVRIAFSTRRPDAAMLANLREALAARSAYMTVFFDLVPVPDARHFQAQLSKDVTDELDRLHAASAGSDTAFSQTDTRRWIELLNRHIDTMGYIGERLSQSITGAIQRIHRRAYSEMWLGAAFMAICAIVVALLWLAAALRRSRRWEALAAQVFEHATEGITVTDATGIILRVNRAFCDITGYRPEEVIGRNPRILQSGCQDAAFYADMWRHVTETGSWTGELWNRRKSGELYPETLSLSSLRDARGCVTHYVGVFSDISQRKKSDSLIDQLSRYDSLTGLLNWGTLVDDIGVALQRARTREHAQAAILLLGLDRFRNVNDSLGHAGGDLVLETIAARLVEAIGDGARVGRRGADEFCVFLEEPDAERAIRRSHDILAVVCEPIVACGHELVVTASIGCSVFPLHGSDAQQLIRCADTAMQHAKKEGGNLCLPYDEGMDGNSLERLTLERHLRRAVVRGEFVLQYQPQIDMRSGRIVGAEALVRWRHPELGMIAPAKFITLAEETGLILDIGAWVLREACVQAQTWQEAGHRGVQVAVNLSGLQFRQPGLDEQVARVLAETGLAAADLDLEITESTMVADPESAIATIRRIKTLGVKFSVDDFGTGYSSLAYLKRFPIDTLKIDRTFVSNCHEGGQDAALAETIVNLARSLRLKAIAEGVETAAQLAFLQGCGCDVAQGYLFSPPVGAKEFHALLAAGRRLGGQQKQAA